MYFSLFQQHWYKLGFWGKPPCCLTPSYNSLCKYTIQFLENFCYQNFGQSWKDAVEQILLFKSLLRSFFAIPQKKIIVVSVHLFSLIISLINVLNIKDLLCFWNVLSIKYKKCSTSEKFDILTKF